MHPSELIRCSVQAYSKIQSLVRLIPGCCLLALVVPATVEAQQKQFADKTTALRKPYVEWTLEYLGATGNKYDVAAAAMFTHEDSGETRKSVIFYSGSGDTWNFRFTGTKPGTWTIETSGPGSLGGWTGRVIVADDGEDRRGFLRSRERAWVWSGTGQEIVPQFVMMNRPAEFWTNGTVHTDTIEHVIREFADETGFTGFHFSGGGGKWFELGIKDTQESHENPDPRTFEVLEQFIMRAYRSGAATHIWFYGSDGYGHRSGPLNLGGPRSAPPRRVLRYIAGRLGPLPGWTMGYGYDLHRWAEPDELTWYEDFTEDHLGGWDHIIGARADTLESLNDDGSITRRPLSGVYWMGDYSGHYDYRVPYRHYVRTYEYAHTPAFQEDRFRIRTKGQFQPKDYTPEMTVRGLWHSTMAGGVANIWGNLLPHSDNERGSEPYDNGEAGTIRGQEVVVDIKDAIRTYATFWFEEDRFSSRLVRDNVLTRNDPGADVLSAENPHPISVCLRDESYEHYVFYTEATDSVQLDLRGSNTSLPAIAVDTKKSYREIDLGMLSTEKQTWEAPYVSNWVIAVGRY